MEGGCWFMDCDIHKLNWITVTEHLTVYLSEVFSSRSRPQKQAVVLCAEQI